jgi:hypothetical protein
VRAEGGAKWLSNRNKAPTRSHSYMHKNFTINNKKKSAEMKKKRRRFNGTTTKAKKRKKQ